MEDSMLFRALREFTSGLLNQLLINLAGKYGKTWLEEFKRFLRQEPCWIGGLIEFIFKRKVDFILKPTQREFNVARDISTLLPTKKEGGKLGYRDESIVGWLGDITINGRASEVRASLYAIPPGLPHYQIINASKKLEIYRGFNIFDACEFVSRLISTEEAKDYVSLGDGILIYLKERHNSDFFRLSVYRNRTSKDFEVIMCKVREDGNRNHSGILLN